MIREGKKIADERRAGNWKDSMLSLLVVDDESSGELDVDWRRLVRISSAAIGCKKESRDWTESPR